jgi:hypothetical protein
MDEPFAAIFREDAAPQGTLNFMTAEHSRSELSGGDGPTNRLPSDPVERRESPRNYSPKEIVR